MKSKVFQIQNFHYFFRIQHDNSTLFSLDFSETKKGFINPQLSLKISRNVTSPFEREVKNQIQAYFNGKLQQFDIPTFQETNLFSEKVFSAIEKIPYGKTLTYKQIAEKIKFPKASRAVGRSTGSNRIPIIIPCHRVIGSSGGLVGYSGGGGLLFKSYLLLLEKKFH